MSMDQTNCLGGSVQILSSIKVLVRKDLTLWVTHFLLGEISVSDYSYHTV